MKRNIGQELCAPSAATFVLRFFAFSICVLMITVLATVGAIQAQSQTQGSKAAKPAPSPAKGMSASIQISGRWVIEVRNPDGKITARREFENAIQNTGMSYLAALLAGNNSPGQLSIMLNGSASTFVYSGGEFATLQSSSPGGPCSTVSDVVTMPVGLGVSLVLGSGGAPPFSVPCVITAPTNHSSYGSVLGIVCGIEPGLCSTNLAETAPTISQSNAGDGLSASLTLSGTIIPSSPNSGSITDVETVFETCSNATTTANCVDFWDFKANKFETGTWDAMNFFTEATLATPVPYTPGQTIAATVTFTFSSPTS
jgi:hypothetical protein